MTRQRLKTSTSYKPENVGRSYTDYISKKCTADTDALAMMKKLEAKRKRKMRTYRVDSRTIICAEPRRAKEIIERYPDREKEGTKC